MQYWQFARRPILLVMNNKSSAVAEMVDRLATIDTGRKEGVAVLLSGGAGSP